MIALVALSGRGGEGDPQDFFTRLDAAGGDEDAMEPRPSGLEDWEIPPLDPLDEPDTVPVR